MRNLNEANMLSRINLFPRYNAIVRQISTNLILSKQYQVKTEQASSERVFDKSSSNQPKFKNNLGKQFKNFDSKKPKQADLKIKNLFENRPESGSTKSTNLRDEINKIIEQFKQNKNSFQNLIQPCQVRIQFFSLSINI